MADSWKERSSVTLAAKVKLFRLKSMRMVLRFSCDGVPLKFDLKTCRAFSLAVQIIWAYFAGQDL